MRKPYIFKGRWTREEKDKVKATLLAYVPKRIGPTFNTWIFHKHKSRLYVRRSTWDVGGISTNSVDALLDRIHDYYAEK